MIFLVHSVQANYDSNLQRTTRSSSRMSLGSDFATTELSRRKQKKRSTISRSVLEANETVNISGIDEDSIIEPTPVKKRKPQKRKLRPEDERTLEILAQKFHRDHNGAICKVDSCTSRPLKSTKRSNLKRHLSTVHPKVYASLFPHEIDKKKQTELEIYNVMHDAIELVTVNGYPFYMLDSSGMRGFIEARLKPLRLEGHTLLINRHIITQKVAETSGMIKNRIRLELDARTISIMFDVCTIATLSMLGVNAMFMENGAVKNRLLGIIQIGKRHTAINLADMLYDIFIDYNIHLKNVFSFTTDTALNMVKISDVLNSVANSNEIVSNIDIETENVTNNLEDDIESEAELQSQMQNLDTQTQLVKHMTENVASKNDSIVLINHINCCTHVLQLAVNDALEESNASEIISKVRDMCITMRSQIVMIEIRKMDTKIIQPPLDIITRWNSKYLMVTMHILGMLPA